MTPGFADVERRFADAMRTRGILPPREIIADGKWHRCDVDAKHGKNDASYFLHADSPPAGGFENHQDNQGWQNWCSVDTDTLPPAERAAYLARIEAARKAREADEAKIKADARERAARLLSEAQPAPPSHQYLKDKKVKPHGLRVGKDGWLVVPLRDADGTLHTVQRIGPDGTKLFLKGGLKHGCFFVVGKLADNPERLDYAEGFATAASIFEAIGRPVVVTGDCGNMLPVAESLRKKYPGAAPVYWADNDVATPGNPGLSAASYAAKVTGGRVVLPGDFNDLAKDHEPEVVKACGEREAVPSPAAATETAAEVVIPPRIGDAAIQLWSTPNPPALATPFEPLNRFLAGGLRGLNALVAATGLGKTSLALLLGRWAALTVPVLYVSTELGCRQAIARIAGQVWKCPWLPLWEGSAVTGQAIAQVTAGLDFRCMEYRDTGEMFAIANAIATAEGKAPFLILDYLQGAARDPGIDRRLAVSGVSNALLQWCRATDAVALMVSSTARVSYALPDKVARDLVGTAKESGDTEYDCSAVLYAELEPCPLGGSAAGVLHVAKSRFGTVGVVGVSFDGASGLFTLDDSGLNPLERKILGAIRAGHHSANAIQAAVGKQRKKVLEALCAMRDRNLIDADYNIISAECQESRQNGQNAAMLPGTSSQSGSGTGTTLTFPSLTGGSGTGTAPCGFGTGSHPLGGNREPPTEPAAEDDPDGEEIS